MNLQRLTSPAMLLRVEGAALFALSILLYHRIEASLLLFGLLMLTPDIAMLGYLAGKQVGAITYNLAHFEALPVVLAAYGLLEDNTLALAVALIWVAHIGLDRMLGFGLKYESDFKDTHLNQI